MSERVAYSELLPGDVVKEYDTWFVVTGVKSFRRRGCDLHLVTTVAVTEPHRVLAGIVDGVGGEWQIQGLSDSAFTVRESFGVRESAGTDGWLYERVTQGVVNGSPCRVSYRIDENRHAHLRVGDLSVGEQIGHFELGTVATGDLPGLVDFSRDLGKLLRF